mmetsp:Transcript_34158/g.71389  ORF Transcript_34158/g.71389 Transcript_34158/m.71389 type:complete len:94 (+) Transcript_34158:2021-2302(+)
MSHGMVRGYESSSLVIDSACDVIPGLETSFLDDTGVKKETSIGLHIPDFKTSYKIVFLVEQPDKSKIGFLPSGFSVVTRFVQHKTNKISFSGG